MAISLEKGQKISLEKEAGGTLTKIIMGLGWDAKKTGGFFGFGKTEQPPASPHHLERLPP